MPTKKGKKKADKIDEAKVRDIIEKVRPYIKMHGGDVQFAAIERDGIVRLRIMGACAHCGLADMTYNKMLGGILQQEVPGVTGVLLDTIQ